METGTKSRVSAKQALTDIRAGMSDARLMEKYDLSYKGLESLFNKLVKAGLLDESELRRRQSRSESTAAEASPQPATDLPKPKPRPSAPAELPDWVRAVAQDLKSGLHDNEIMRRHNLSPSRLKEVSEKLVAAGYLNQADLEERAPKKTKFCPWCGQEMPRSDAKCKACGRWTDPSAAPDGATEMPGAQPAVPGQAPVGVPVPRPPGALPAGMEADFYQEDKECPWELRDGYGLVNGYFQTAIRCLISPVSFFARLPTSGGYGDPILFGIATMIVGVLLGFLWFAIIHGGMAALILGLFSLIFGLISLLIRVAIFVVLTLFLCSGVLHLALMLFQGAKHGFEGTFRVTCYSSVAVLLNAVPYVGWVLSLYYLVLMAIGLKEVHETTYGRAIGAVLVLVGVLGVLGFLARLILVSYLESFAM